MAGTKATPYLIQFEAKGFFQNDAAVLDAVMSRLTGKGHRIYAGEIDESSKPKLGHPGVVRTLSEGVYSNDYNFGKFTKEMQDWLTETFTPARTPLGETRFAVTVKILELRFDVDFDETMMLPSESEFEQLAMEADAKA